MECLWQLAPAPPDLLAGVSGALHCQTIRDPLHAHGGVFPEDPGNGNFPRLASRKVSQLLRIQAGSRQPLCQQSLCFFLPVRPPFLTRLVTAMAHPFQRRLAQFQDPLRERLAPPIPSPTQVTAAPVRIGIKRR